MTALLKIHIDNKNINLKGQIMKVLDNIWLDINQGEFVSIVGPSGCGKTTILKMIMGLESDFQGEIVLNDRIISGPGLERGIVFQDHRLLPWLNVKDNIKFALPTSELQDDKRIEEVLDLVGLQAFSDMWPRQLSGGMAQRVAIARAIVNVPKILLLDEAFGSLDDFTRAKMQRELQRILSKFKTTTVMVTHNLEEAILLSNRIVLLSDKPTSILEIINIDMEHPRDKKSKDFLNYRTKLIANL